LIDTIAVILVVGCGCGCLLEVLDEETLSEVWTPSYTFPASGGAVLSSLNVIITVSALRQMSSCHALLGCKRGDLKSAEGAFRYH
jgi:hypothetical protein